MKRLTLTTIPLLCAAFAPLCADSQGMQSTDAVRKQQMYMDEMNKITPSGEPAVTRWADPYLTADFIWWRAVEEGLDYAFKGTTTFPHNADRGRVHHPDFSYEPGFKVGFGLKFRHDGWDFFSQYTRLIVEEGETRNRARSDRDGNSSVQSNITLPEGGNLNTFWAGEANAKWGLRFNVLDLELGRNFWISKRLTLRPFVGMKFDWTSQKFRVKYDDIDVDNIYSTTLNNGAELKMKMQQHQWAVGLRTGLDTAWYMARKWCIFGDVAFSGMLNDFDVHRKDRVERVNGTAWTQNHLIRKSHPVTAVIEWALGLRYETAFYHDDYMFQLQAGWEEQIWFNQNQFIFFPNAGSSDLSFQGLTIKAAFYF
jgi:Legionella pneumophila major outer membrane protein precursor